MTTEAGERPSIRREWSTLPRARRARDESARTGTRNSEPRGGTKAIRGGPPMKRGVPSIAGFLILVLLGVLASGCAAHDAKIDGTVGAIHWHVTDQGRLTRTGYPFTLVLAETQGVGMQITKIGWRAYQPG